MSKEEHNKIAIVENLIWDISRILQPNSIIELDKIEEAKKVIIKIFK